VEDSPLDNRAVMIGGTTGILGEWGPEDADNRYEGRMTARQALVKSKNGATVRIGMDAGIEAVLSFVLRLVFVLRFARIRRHFSAAAKLLWPSSQWHTQFSRTVAGDRAHRTSWSGSRKKTEHWCGMRSSRASGKL